MHNSRKILLVNESVKVIKAIYEAGDDAKQEEFKTFDTSIDVDDLLIVESDTRHKMTVVKVVETDVVADFESEIKIKWVVGKIDPTEFRNVIKEEQEMVKMIDSAQRNKKREELKEALLADQEKLKELPIALMSGDDEDASEAPPKSDT